MLQKQYHNKLNKGAKKNNYHKTSQRYTQLPHFAVKTLFLYEN